MRDYSSISLKLAIILLLNQQQFTRQSILYYEIESFFLLQNSNTKWQRKQQQPLTMSHPKQNNLRKLFFTLKIEL